MQGSNHLIKNIFIDLKFMYMGFLWQVVDADNPPFIRVFAQMGDAEIVDFMGKAGVGAGIKGALDLG
jgi:hypothetical protein